MAKLDISHLSCLILQHGFQLFHHKLTNGTQVGITDTHQRLEHIKGDFRYICNSKSTKDGQLSGVNHVIPEKICLLQIPPWWRGTAWQQVEN